MQAEESEYVLCAKLVLGTIGSRDDDAFELVAGNQEAFRDALDVSHASGRDLFAHPCDGGRCRAKFSTTMHEREVARLAAQVQYPVERRIATTEDDEVPAMKCRRALDAVVNLSSLECFSPFDTETTRLK